MYTRKEVANTRQEFWTTFGRYMTPVSSASGEKVNWVNYKTGIKGISFRMEASNTGAKVYVSINAPGAIRESLYQRFLSLKNLFHDVAGSEWEWHANKTDVDGNTLSVIETTLPGVSIFKKEDWPALISFFKKSMISLDAFWYQVKEILE